MTGDNLRNSANLFRQVADNLDKIANDTEIIDNRINNLEIEVDKSRQFKNDLMELLKKYNN